MEQESTIPSYPTDRFSVEEFLTPMLSRVAWKQPQRVFAADRPDIAGREHELG